MDGFCDTEIAKVLVGLSGTQSVCFLSPPGYVSKHNTPTKKLARVGNIQIAIIKTAEFKSKANTAEFETVSLRSNISLPIYSYFSKSFQSNSISCHEYNFHSPDSHDESSVANNNEFFRGIILILISFDDRAVLFSPLLREEGVQPTFLLKAGPSRLPTSRQKKEKENLP